jgi:hypothetical protein
MSEPINNITDLRVEIARLRVVKTEQEIAIKQHFSSPMAIFNTLFSSSDKDKGGIFKMDDLISMASRFVLPFALNKTIFRSSNFIVKTIVGLLSQKASGFINEKNLGSVWDKVKGIIPKKWTNKADKTKPIDYGIPPLSESY